MLSWLSLLAVLFHLQRLAHAFSFTAGTPSECENLTINWQGGTSPFLLHLIPVFDVLRNITIPPTAFNNGQGSFTFQLPLPHSMQFVIAMSDAEGFGTGGTTNVLTVETSQAQGGKCDTKSPGTAFTYQLNTALQQCRPFTVSGYSPAAQPVSFYGVIPLGQAFVVHPSPGPSFDWPANVAAGTSIIFFMLDAQGRQGGSSDILRVGNSNDASCLNKNSPSSTASTPAGPTHSPTSTRPSPSVRPKPGGISVGAIAATLIGAILFLAMVITMALFFFRRKKASYTPQAGFQRRFSFGDQTSFGDHADHPDVTPKPYPYINASTHTPFASAYTLQTGGQYNANPFNSTTSVQYQSPLNTYQPYSTSNVNLFPPSEARSDLSNPHSPNTGHSNPYPPPPVGAVGTSSGSLSSRENTVPSAHDRKGAGARGAPTRYIVHTDLEDDRPLSDGGIVELPPQYSEHRAPLTVVDTPSELAYDQPPSPIPPKS